MIMFITGMQFMDKTCQALHWRHRATPPKADQGIPVSEQAGSSKLKSGTVSSLNKPLQQILGGVKIGLSRGVKFRLSLSLVSLELDLPLKSCHKKTRNLDRINRISNQRPEAADCICHPALTFFRYS